MNIHLPIVSQDSKVPCNKNAMKRNVIFWTYADHKPTTTYSRMNPAIHKSRNFTHLSTVNPPAIVIWIQLFVYIKWNENGVSYIPDL